MVAPVAPVAPAAALAATILLAASCWVVAIHRMDGMDMGVATRIGSFSSFFGLWLAMMAAMMLPGVLGPVWRITRARPGLLATPRFLASYLAVWGVVGAVVYAVYRPHSTVVAGAVVIAAGIYELTPLKRHCRQQGQARLNSGLGYGLCCAGSSLGLMLMLVALGVMSVAWMAAIAAVIVGQKLLPPAPVVDASLAAGILVLGVLILAAPSAIPGLAPAM